MNSYTIYIPISGYSFLDPCAFYFGQYAPFWCDMSSSFDHNIKIMSILYMLS